MCFYKRTSRIRAPSHDTVTRQDTRRVSCERALVDYPELLRLLSLRDTYINVAVTLRKKYNITLSLRVRLSVNMFSLQ